MQLRTMHHSAGLLGGLLALSGLVACGDDGSPGSSASLDEAGDTAEPGPADGTPNEAPEGELDPSPGPGAEEPVQDPANPTPVTPVPGAPEDPTATPTPSPDLGEETGPGALPEGTNPGGVALDCTGSEAAVSPLLKLSTLQYRNTVRDLLDAAGMGAVTPELEAALSAIPDDDLGDSFRALDDRVAMQHVQGMLDVGLAVGDALLANPAALEAAAGSCALDATLSDACATDFLTSFLRLVYRRPVASEDLATYLELVADRTGPEAIRAMVVVALSSPRFVKHVEIDGTPWADSTDLLQLTSYEIASRLSYTFWQTMPDAELLAAAEDGSLATPAGFDAQLRRVFDSPRTQETLWQFFHEWLKLEKFTGFETTRPGFIALAADTGVADDGPTAYADMVQEVRDLTRLLTFERDGTVIDLLTNTESVTPSATLASLYGVAPYAGDGAYPTLPEGTRAGLFQRAALLVSNLEQTNPFHRGALVRRAVLCDDLPQPDPNSLPPGSLDPPPSDLAQTTRERFQAKVEGNGLCESCHAAFSDIGYVLESFDALGRARTVEQVFDEQTGELLAELPIDTSAVARIDLADTTPVTGAIELSQRMLDSGKVQACLARNYFEFATRRPVSADTTDACTLADLATRLADPEHGLAGAFQRVAQYDGFFQRKVGPR